MRRIKHRNSNRRLALLVVGLIAFTSAINAALPDDKEEIKIEAGWSEIDLANGVVIHHKPVVVTQGSRRLDSDLLTITRAKDGGVDKIIAQGNPAHYIGLTDANPKSPLLKASAQHITWEAKNEKLILKDKARVEQNGDVITAPVIEYYMKENKVLSPQNPHGRTKIVLQPRPDASFNLQGNAKQ